MPIAASFGLVPRPRGDDRVAIGVLSPVGGADTMPYGIYRLLGPEFIVISISLALASFKPEDIDRAVAAIDPRSATWCRAAPTSSSSPARRSRSASARRVSSASLRGPRAERPPGPLLGAQRRRCRARRRCAQDRHRQQVERALNRELAAFLAHFDIVVVGTATDLQEPAQFQRADLKSGAALAYRLGRDALERAPDADALYIGGGAWFADPAADGSSANSASP